MPANVNGKSGEEYAANQLLQKGYTIVARNYHTRYGEIDIIAAKDDIFAFVEVKTRAKNYLASGLEAISFAKQRKIIKTAQLYLVEQPTELQPRFDVYEIITHSTKSFTVLSEQYIEGAFDVNECNRND